MIFPYLFERCRHDRASDPVLRDQLRTLSDMIV